MPFRLHSLLHHFWAFEGSSLVDRTYEGTKAQWKIFRMQLISGNHKFMSIYVCLLHKTRRKIYHSSVSMILNSSALLL
jgi:hypothetical protein